VRRLAFVVEGRLTDLTGGQLFNRRIVGGLRDAGREVVILETAGDVSREIAALPPGLPVAIDGTALPAISAAVPELTERCRAVAFVHHPLSQEYGLPLSELRAAEALEQRLLPLFRGALCPSQRSAAAVAALGVPVDRIAVTPPGTDKPNPLPMRAGGPVRRLLYVANIIPRKGHRVLIEALAGLADLDWELCCIGALDRDAAAAERLRRAIAERDLGTRVYLVGAKPPDEAAGAYAATDAFVSASLHEGYGMAWAEAMAWGLPQVSTTAGAVAEIVPPDAGLLVPPGDAAAFGDALRRLIAEPGLAARLAAGARRAAARLPDWPTAIAGWITAFDHLCGGAGAD